MYDHEMIDALRGTNGCTADRELAFPKRLINRAIAVNRTVRRRRRPALAPTGCRPQPFPVTVARGQRCGRGDRRVTGNGCSQLIACLPWVATSAR